MRVEITIMRVEITLERVLAKIYLKIDTQECEFRTQMCHFHTFRFWSVFSFWLSQSNASDWICQTHCCCFTCVKATLYRTKKSANWLSLLTCVRATKKISCCFGLLLSCHQFSYLLQGLVYQLLWLLKKTVKKAMNFAIVKKN
jgi:hypothetical protein